MPDVVNSERIYATYRVFFDFFWYQSAKVSQRSVRVCKRSEIAPLRLKCHDLGNSDEPTTSLTMTATAEVV